MPNNAAPNDAAKDTIDRFIVEWTAERPDLDFTYLAASCASRRICASVWTPGCRRSA